MSLTFQGWTANTDVDETATNWDGTGLTTVGMTKTVQATGADTLNVETGRTVNVTITVNGSNAADATVGIVFNVLPPATSSNPLSQAETTLFDAVVTEANTQATAVKNGIVWTAPAAP